MNASHLLRSARTASTKAHSFSTAHPPRVVVSRRKVIEYQTKHPKRIEKESESKKESTPWPRNMRIAGYIATATFVPYSIAWFLSMQPTLRESLPENIQDILRHYFGEADAHALPYPDLVAASGRDGTHVPHVLPGEPPLDVRQQQREIEKLNRELLLVRVQRIEGDTFADDQVQEVLGSVPARQEAIAKAVGIESRGVIAVAFPNTTTESYEDNGTDFIREEMKEEEMAIRALTKATNVFSLWQAVPMMEEGNNNSSNKAMSSSNDEIEREGLRYRISQLEKELRDPMSSRSIDSIQEELSQTRRELKTKTWRKWLPI